MQDNLTGNIPAFEAYQAELQARMAAILADADYREGFYTGIEAYEEECECQGRKLTAFEAYKDIIDELESAQERLNAEAFSTEKSNPSPRPMFNSGFLAGWLYAHLFAPEEVALQCKDACKASE